jgi:hypothetical protein
MFIFLPFAGFAVGLAYKNTVLALYNECINTKTNVSILPVKSEKEVPTSTIKKFRGIIRYEKIPEEMQLGDYWYIMYFDEPYLLEENASGRPVYMKSLEITEFKDGFHKIDNFINKHVEVSGNYGWGYAESTLIEPVAIAEL